MFGSQATKTRGFRYYQKKRITIPQIPMTYHVGIFKTIPEKWVELFGFTAFVGVDVLSFLTRGVLCCGFHSPSFSCWRDCTLFWRPDPPKKREASVPNTQNRIQNVFYDLIFSFFSLFYFPVYICLCVCLPSWKVLNSMYFKGVPCLSTMWYGNRELSYPIIFSLIYINMWQSVLSLYFLCPNSLLDVLIWGETCAMSNSTASTVSEYLV